MIIVDYFKESEEALSREAAAVLRISKDGVDGDTNKFVLFFLLISFEIEFLITISNILCIIKAQLIVIRCPIS